MFDSTINVIKNKNKIEKARRVRQKNELAYLRNKSAFQAELYNSIKYVDVLLQDNDVEAIKINVPDKLLAQFSAAVYSEELASYDIRQVDNEPTKFYIRRKYVMI